MQSVKKLGAEYFSFRTAPLRSTSGRREWAAWDTSYTCARRSSLHRLAQRWRYRMVGITDGSNRGVELPYFEQSVATTDNVTNARVRNSNVTHSTNSCTVESSPENQLGYCGRRLLILLIHASRVLSSGTSSTGSHSRILSGIGVIPNLDVSNTLNVISRIIGQSHPEVWLRGTEEVSFRRPARWSSNDPLWRDPDLCLVSLCQENLISADLSLARFGQEMSTNTASATSTDTFRRSHSRGGISSCHSV